MVDIAIGNKLEDEEVQYLHDKVGPALTNALIVVAEERYLRSTLTATAKDTALRLIAAHLRAHNPERSEIYREKKLEQYKQFCDNCTIRKRLQDMIDRRQDLSQPWKGDDEKEYVKMCKQFDALNK
ncbi:unnamed protein product [Amoebophrya sp. A25]|nr:unnamed protein product [Amoebophrya sp. A25]|eukprot:GSA25T00022559001.1